MKSVKLIDMTLKMAAGQRAGALSFKERLELARSLDRLKVDVIELPPLTGGKADQLCNKTIAKMVKAALSATVNVKDTDIGETWESIRTAVHPRLNVEAPCSPVQMEYDAHMKAPALLAAVEARVKACRALCADVEFTARDATRAERDFLVQVIQTALAAGANRVTLCDSAGILLPAEFAGFVQEVRAAAGETEAAWYVQVSDVMHMAAASAAEAVTRGVDGVKCAAVPVGVPTLEQMADFIRLRGQDLDIAANVRTTELRRMVKQLTWITGAAGEAQPAAGASASEAAPGITLTAGDSQAEVVKVVQQLGYDLSEEDNARVYEAFRRVAVKKEFVSSRELDAIVASTAMQVPSTYRIESYVINSGNVITATANIALEKNGEKLRGVSVGDGPIDAAFRAIEQVIGHHYELDDFQIQAVTEGREAMGSALVKLRADGRLYSGNGISTDIIGAAIRAYISALNKIVYEEA